MIPKIHPTVDDAYWSWLQAITWHGLTEKPRELATKEVQHLTTAFRMKWPVLRCPPRKPLYKFMAAEALWIIAGDNRVATIAPYNKKIAEFSDDGVRFAGAYGPLFQQQLEHVVKTLDQDISSRQAVMTFWRPSPEPSKDIPCTVSLHFMVRDGTISCHVYMRSSDAWLGVPYDWFNFSMITLYVACLVNQYKHWDPPIASLGACYFTAGSAHLYTKNLGQAEKVITWGRRALPRAQPPEPVPAEILKLGWPRVHKALVLARDLNAPPEWD